MIEIQNLTKTFGTGAEAFTALSEVSVTIRQNEFFTLLGPSGCGKTTLLRTIAGFVDPTSGTMTLDGADVLASPPYVRPVNTVFQNYALFPHMTVTENIGFGLEMQDRPKAEIKQTVGEMLELVQMTPLANRATSEISGGQQQRVALARALAPRPKV
ncbi:MAG: ATP-binding cassette domain-containing protein, partial [Paracoccaceae bacterium]|nr:ATP-binding cassette domain-containing protein [Paracoccaceae bacterium]